MIYKRNKKNVVILFSKNEGFSLIELIVVITIMAILTTILAPMLLRYIAQSRAAACTSNRAAFVRYYSVYEIDAGASGTVPEFLSAAKSDGLPSDDICPGGGECTFKIEGGRLLAICDVHDNIEEGAAAVPEITQPSFFVQFSGLTGATVEVYQHGVWKTYGTNYSNSALVEGIDDVVSSLRVKKGGMAYSFFNVRPNTPENTTPFVVPIATITITNNSGLIALQTGLTQSDWVYNYASLAAGETVSYTVINNGNTFYLVLYPKGQLALRVPITNIAGPIPVSDYTYTISFPSNITVNRISQSDWIYNPVPSGVSSVELLISNQTTTFIYTPNGGSQKTITITADGASQPAW